MVFAENIDVFFDTTFGFGEDAEYYSDLSTKVSDIVIIKDTEENYFQQDYRKKKTKELIFTTPYLSSFSKNQFIKYNSIFYKIKQVLVDISEKTCQIHTTKD